MLRPAGGVSPGLPGSWPRRRLAAAAVALSLALPHVAAASEETALAVMVALDEATETLATSLWPRLEGAVSRHVGPGLISAEEIGLAEAAEIFEHRRAEGLEAFEQGRRALDHMQYARAEMRFSQSLALFEQSDLREAVDDLLHALALRAAALYYLGKPEEAIAELRRVLTIRSDYVFDPRRASPEIEQIMATARNRLRLAQPVPVELQSAPAPARVWINGQPKGTTPREIDVPPGRHLVTLACPVQGFVQTWVEVSPGASIRLTLEQTRRGRELERALDGASSGLLARRPSPGASELAALAGVDEVFLVGVERVADGYRLMGARVAADGHIEAHARMPAGEDPAALPAKLETLVSSLAVKSLPREADGRAVTTSMASRGAVGGRTMGLAAIGGGAAAGAAGVVVGLGARRQTLEARSIPQVRTEDFDSAIASARRQAAVANALYAASLACVGVGTWLLLREPTAGAHRSASLGAVPSEDGVLLTVGGTF